jgi:ABC-2 type transport system permease protein
MSKTRLIIQREYLTRVRKKSFIIMSILGPLLFAMLMVVPIWLMTRDSGDARIIAVVDENAYFAGKLSNTGSIVYDFRENDISLARNQLDERMFYGVLHIPPLDFNHPEGIRLYADRNPSMDIMMGIERSLGRVIEDYRIEEAGIDREILKKLNANVSVQTINISKGEEKESNTGVATAVGYVASLLIYFFILFYGVQIMRGVIEEKNNRIVEVIISSVRPFQLMLGKIIGIGAVGLTQFLIWAVFTVVIYSGAIAILGFNNLDPEQIQQVGQVTSTTSVDETEQMVQEIFKAIETINIPLILLSFLFYFLGAYLLYGSLFAAIGSAADTDSDAQQFQLPVTIPLIISIVVLGAVLKDPDGSLAFWMSIIPLFSPVVMMMRIPFGVPVWQLILSMGLLIGGFIFTTWMAGRIYRIGVLMHGAKVNYKILAKWLFMKN